MLQTMVFEPNRHSLQRFGEDMGIPSTAEEVKKFNGCYFWMGSVKMLNKQSFWEEDLVTLEFFQSSREIDLKHSFCECKNKGRQ